MMFDVPFSKSAEQMHEENKSRTSKIFQDRRDRRLREPEVMPNITFESEPGAIEAAIAEGRMDLKSEYILPDGKIDDVKLEEVALNLLNSNIDLKVLSKDVAKDIESMIVQLSQDSEFAYRKDEFEDVIKTLEAVQNADDKAIENAKTDVIDSIDNDVDVIEPIALYDAILKKASEYGVNDWFEGVRAEDIAGLQDEINDLQEHLESISRFRVVKRGKIKNQINEKQTLLDKFEGLKFAIDNDGLAASNVVSGDRPIDTMKKRRADINASMKNSGRGGIM